MKKVRACAGIVLALMLVACAKDPVPQRDTRSPGVCRFMGNSIDDRVCATSFVSVLVDPALYDGERVSFMAWAEPVNDVIMLFPSRDLLDARDPFSSIVVYPVDSPESFKKLVSMTKDDPQYVRVSGAFHHIAGGEVSPSFEAVDVDRLGVLVGMRWSR